MTTAAASSRVPPSLLGMTLFVSSEVMFFGALFASYFMLRGTTEPWPPSGSIETSLLLPGAMTACLLASSGTVHAGVAAFAAGRREAAARWLGATIVLGTVFLAGQLYEYAELAREGFAASSDVFSTLFFTITGFHGLHVAIGLVMLVTVWLRLGRYGDKTGPAEGAAYYWHFVDGVWVLVFLTLYVAR
ncbi:MAG TPA: heme-copper oxidase subunit III [Actinomycetota bacterium]|nr:heme-copper oxidase subunit III [Actinomycetota bacterium]